MNNWLKNRSQIPGYLKTGRVISLSKEDTEYPTRGQIRTICILPSLTKLYELNLLHFLNKEAKRLGDIPENQRGFKGRCSTMDNLIDVFSMMSDSI